MRRTVFYGLRKHTTPSSLINFDVGLTLTGTGPRFNQQCEIFSQFHVTTEAPETAETLPIPPRRSQAANASIMTSES